jgi:hypothetical protein
MWDLWWTKWHWVRFFLEFFGFPLSISFTGAPLLGKGQKIIIIVIFIMGLHNKLQGCGASVASAAGPFSNSEVYNISFHVVLASVCNVKAFYYVDFILLIVFILMTVSI